MPFCVEHDCIHMNSHFDHPTKHKYTFRELGTVLGSAHTPEAFAELDHCIINRGAQAVIKNIMARDNFGFSSNHFPLEIDIIIRLSPTVRIKKEPKADYSLLSNATTKIKFVNALLEALPSPLGWDERGVDEFYKNCVVTAQDTQYDWLVPPKNETFECQTLTQSTQNLFLRAVAFARGGRGEMAIESYTKFRKVVKVEKREKLELSFKKGHWEHISPRVKLQKMVKGAYTVKDDNQIMRSAASRAELFADYLRGEVWSTKVQSEGPCPV